MYPAEEHSTQGVPNNLGWSLPLAITIMGFAEWTQGLPNNPPVLGTSALPPVRLSAERIRREHPPQPSAAMSARERDCRELLSRLKRYLRNRCDRGADERVIGASLQQA